MKASRIFSLILVVCLVGGLLSGCGKGQENVLKLYNYGDYMSDELLKQFEKETGIRVRQDTFDTNEDMYVPVANKQVQYDLIICGDYTIEKMIKNDLLQPLNYDNIPNAANLDKDYMAKLAGADPGNKYAIPYTWGTVGILYNTTMIPEGSITSWRDLWDAKYEQYGIVMQNSVRDTFMVAEMILGIDMNTTKEEDLKRVVDLLMEQKPIVQSWKNDEARDELIERNAGIGMIYSGEYLYCTEKNAELAFVIPEEGTNVWFDCFVIPANAQNVSAAEKFIDFMLRAESGLATFEELGYPIPNTAAIQLLDEEYLTDENIFPPQELLDKCDVYHYLGEDADELLNKYWKQYRSN
ncbi:MAG: spermidine/putrescine ABC transporter substrate-binding protein [Lachnospiraceae bacterium]|nr:spermidine/putrescine ABC transporter substrate-binding protein [Lachnospiraceae bacterium]